MSTFLALDFDGVLCDSLPECYVSSRYAAYPDLPREIALEEYKSKSPRFKKFSQWRPWVRSGEDYVLIQLLIEKVETPVNQREMDFHISEAGIDSMTRYKSEIYSIREKMLLENKVLWLSLNPLFGPLIKNLNSLSLSPEVCIISTKKSLFITEILNAAGINWAENRILEAAGTAKIELMNRLWGADAEIIFIDDQPDHFAGLPKRVTCLLPEWGYIQDSWKSGGTHWKLLDKTEADRVVAPWLISSHRPS